MNTTLLLQTEMLNRLVELGEIGVGFIATILCYILLRDGIECIFSLAKHFSNKNT